MPGDKKNFCVCFFQGIVLPRILLLAAGVLVNTTSFLIWRKYTQIENYIPYLQDFEGVVFSCSHKIEKWFLSLHLCMKAYLKIFNSNESCIYVLPKRLIGRIWIMPFSIWAAARIQFWTCTFWFLSSLLYCSIQTSALIENYNLSDL